MNFALYAIGNLESASENAFPQSDLPFDVGEQIAIERVEFTEDAFEIGRAQYGATYVEALRNVRYALVVRYEDAESRIDSNTERRRQDAELLRKIGSKFHAGMASENWKYRMAVEFHEAAHVQSRYWKARFILLIS